MCTVSVPRTGTAQGKDAHDKRKPTVVVLGGKMGCHHAKWYHKKGCDVTAVWSRSAAGAARAEETLKKTFEFDERTYHGAWQEAIPRMLAEHRPDMVSIVTPPKTHLELLDLCSKHNPGCHVMLEKPIFWPSEADETAFADGMAYWHQLVQDHQGIIAVQLQLLVAADHYKEVYSDVTGRQFDVHNIQTFEYHWTRPPQAPPFEP